MTLRYEYANPPPYAHQKLALAKINKRDGKCALYLPMRSGKSRAAIDWLGVAYHNFDLRRVLIVAPATVLPVWANQIAEYLPAHVPREVHVLEGTVAQRTAAVQQIRRAPAADASNAPMVVVVVNYDVVWRDRLKYQLLEWAPQAVVADEGHRISKSGAKQSRAMWALAEQAQHRLLLTGTAITNSPLDFYGQWRFLDGTLWIDPEGNRPLSWSKWREEFADWTHKVAVAGNSYPVFKRYRNLDVLSKVIREVSFTRKIEECFDLPPKTYIDVPVKLSAAGKKLYKQMATDLVAEIESGVVSVAELQVTKLLRLAQISSGFLRDENKVDHEIDTAKLDVALDMIDDMLSAGEKVVLFARFKYDYHALDAALTKARIGHVVLSGESSLPSRGPMIARFQTDPATKVFVAQTAAGSLGIDLTASRMVIMYSLDYRADTYWQAQDRVYGPKQPLPVAIHHLVANVPIDRIMLNSLRAKTMIAEQIIHNPRMLLEEPEIYIPGLDAA